MKDKATPAGNGRVTGSRVRYGEKGRAKRIKTGGARWSEEAEEQFFDILAASCNVTLAAEATGFHSGTVYWHRRKRPEFAARWKDALDQGYARLEMALVEAACDSMADVQFDAERPIPRMTVDQAMNVLRAHKQEARGQGQPDYGQNPRRRSLDEVKASIVKKIKAIEGARGLGNDSPFPFVSSPVETP